MSYRKIQDAAVFLDYHKFQTLDSKAQLSFLSEKVLDYDKKPPRQRHLRNNCKSIFSLQILQRAYFTTPVYSQVLDYTARQLRDCFQNIAEMSRKTDDEVLKGIYNPHISHVLHPLSIRHLAREWLKEDVPNFDYGGFVVGEKEETAVLLMKSPGVLAGRPFFDAVFKELDCTVHWESILEGTYHEPLPVKTVATVSGKVRLLLLGERVALNIITRASGIASAANRLKKLVEKLGWKGEVAGTRKTTPGFRLVEKYALLVGGVSTHRYDLSSMIMLKDNHIWTAGSISQVKKNTLQQASVFF